MNWIVTLFTSPMGKKVVMSLTGLFLCTFLVIHMAGNMQLLLNDGGKTFNQYAYDMTHNPLIKVVSYVTYFLILLHIVQGIVLWLQHKGARAVKYAKQSGTGASWSSRNMGILGTVILVFLIVHLYSFWFKMKFGSLPVDQWGNIDLYTLVVKAFSNPLYVIFYLIALVALTGHLWHGVQSAFQSLGVNHSKYTPIIKAVGYGFAVIIPFLFALQPIFIMFKSLGG